MEKRNKILIAVLVFIFTLAILTDWTNFKVGLSGEAPIEKAID